MSVHLYGIVRAGHPVQPDLKGMASGSPVRLVECGDLAAVVSDIPDDIEFREEDARAHLAVLISLVGEGRPVLPLRLGIATPDEATVCREILEPDGEDLRRQLDHLEGLVEVHLDVFDEEESQLRAVMERDPDVRTLAARIRGGAALEDRIHLGELVAARLQEVREKLGNQLVERLRSVSVQDVPRAGSDDERIAVRWAFLLPAGDLPRFDELVGQLREEFPAVAELATVGPLPPFHFVTTLTPAQREDAAQGAWAPAQQEGAQDAWAPAQQEGAQDAWAPAQQEASQDAWAPTQPEGISQSAGGR